MNWHWEVYKFVLDLLQFPKYIVAPINYNREIKKFILSVYRLEYFSLQWILIEKVTGINYNRQLNFFLCSFETISQHLKLLILIKSFLLSPSLKLFFSCSHRELSKYVHIFKIFSLNLSAVLKKGFSPPWI